MTSTAELVYCVDGHTCRVSTVTLLYSVNGYTLSTTSTVTYHLLFRRLRLPIVPTVVLDLLSIC